MIDWISVKERLPPLRQTVLAWESYGKGKIVQKMRTKTHSVNWMPYTEGNIHTGRYTYWMPLPLPPEEK